VATIDPNEVLADVDLRLPTSNSLTDAQLLSIINSNIITIGDDESYYAEVTCKSLRDAAEINQARASGEQGLKSRKIEDIIEESFYQNGANKIWTDYVNQLPTLCARLGYSGLSKVYSGYILVASGDTIDVNPTNLN